MKIHINTPEEIAETGVVGYVHPFEGVDSICIVIRPGIVDVEGSAMFQPLQAAIFGQAIITAAKVAKGEYKNKDNIQK